MRKKRNLSFILLFIVFGLAGLAIYLGITLQNQNQAPADTNAAVPSDCLTQYLTTDNPGGGPNCNGSTNCKPIPKYCRSTGLFKIKKPGKLFIYSSGLINNYTLTVNNKTVAMQKINGTADVYRGNAAIVVKVGDNINIKLAIGPMPALGWTTASAKNICGELPWGLNDITFILNSVTADKREVTEKMCWGDPPSGNSDFDFNDGFVIVAVEAEVPTNTPTLIPTATPIPTATAIPTATPTPTTVPTLIPTNTPTATPNPTVTLTPTRTATPTITPTGTRPPTSTPTKTPTPTITPTGTRLPTSTPQPTLATKPTLGPQPTHLPPTALIDNRSDTLILGILLMVAGFGLYAYIRNHSNKNYKD